MSAKRDTLTDSAATRIARDLTLVVVRIISGNVQWVCQTLEVGVLARSVQLEVINHQVFLRNKIQQAIPAVDLVALSWRGHVFRTTAKLQHGVSHIYTTIKMEPVFSYWGNVA